MKKSIRNGLIASTLLLTLTSCDTNKISGLRDISSKIIPSDPWAFAVQLTATFFLVLILAKFLVKPIRKFVAARQELIQNNLDEAATKNKEANALLDEANSSIKEAKKTSKEMVENAKVTALNEKDRILNETKEEVASMKEKARKDIENERTQMKQEISDEVIDVALLAASKVVEREITDEDNRKLVSSFIEDKE